MIETKAQIALDLVPLMRFLYKGGVTAIYGGDGTVQLTEELFHKVFPDVKVAVPRASEVYPFAWKETVEGVEFFALSATGKWEAEE